MVQSFTTLLNNPENLQLALKKAPMVISVVLLIACAHVLSQITWALLAESESEQSASMAKSAARVTAKNNDQQAFRELTAANLFGIAGQTKTSGPTKAPETRLNLVLRGVFAAIPMTNASAIIGRGKSGKEEIYGIGDKLPGGVSIKEIHPEHVILDRGGQLETLRMPKDSQPVKLGRTASNNTSATSPADALKSIRKDIMKNPTSFAEYALPVIVRENGKQIGYRLQPQKKGSLLSELGLQPSDVIISINGIPLDNPANGIGALRKLQSASQVNIIVKRNGAEVPLNIQLQ